MIYKSEKIHRRQRKRRERVFLMLASITIIIAAICFKYMILDEKKYVPNVNLKKDAEIIDAKNNFDYISTQQEEVQMNYGDKFNFKSKYGIAVSIDKQKVYVYDNNKLIKSMLCATGVEGSDTPTGRFKIETRAKWFFSQEYQEGGKYYLQFKGDFLFHSVPCDRNKNVIPEEENKLGFKASHGCIRLSLDDSKWLYDTVPNQTDVVIY